MRAVWIGICFSLAAGCRSKGVTVEGDGLDEIDVESTLVFTLDAETSVAGEDVGFTVFMVDSDGGSTPVESYSVVSDIEPSMVVNDASLIATLAGEHVVSVVVAGASGDACQCVGGCVVSFCGGFWYHLGFQNAFQIQVNCCVHFSVSKMASLECNK